MRNLNSPGRAIQVLRLRKKTSRLKTPKEIAKPQLNRCKWTSKCKFWLMGILVFLFPFKQSGFKGWFFRLYPSNSCGKFSVSAEGVSTRITDVATLQTHAYTKRNKGYGTDWCAELLGMSIGGVNGCRFCPVRSLYTS